MSDQTKDLNIIELLMTIREDVSSIKTEMASFKEAQKLEKENTSKELNELEKKLDNVENEYKRKLSELEQRITTKVTGQQSVLNNLVGEVDTLRHADEKKDAKKWKTTVAFICTSIGSMILVKLPDIVALILELKK